MDPRRILSGKVVNKIYNNRLGNCYQVLFFFSQNVMADGVFNAWNKRRRPQRSSRSFQSHPFNCQTFKRKAKYCKTRPDLTEYNLKSARIKSRKGCWLVILMVPWDSRQWSLVIDVYIITIPLMIVLHRSLTLFKYLLLWIFLKRIVPQVHHIHFLRFVLFLDPGTWS